MNHDPVPSDSCVNDTETLAVTSESEVWFEEVLPDRTLPITESAETTLQQASDVSASQWTIPPFPVPWRHPLRALGWILVNLFGIVSLVLILAIIAAIPIVNFLALGYLLEAEGRVAKSGRFRDGFPLLGLAPRVGSIALGLWLWILPLRLLAGAAADAHLINPAGSADRILHRVVTMLSAVISLHLCLALARGGKLSCFFRPLKNIRWLFSQLRNGTYGATVSEGIRDLPQLIRVRYHFWLGIRGFAGAFALLVIPTLLYASLTRTDNPIRILVTILGGLQLVVVLSWVPFLQARYASENRLRAAFEVREIRRLFTHAPLAWLLAVVVLYALSLPLYLLKVALPPTDAMWLVTIVFIVSIYPARLVVGWAYRCATCRERPAWFVWRWSSRLVMFAALAFYVLVLFFTPGIGEKGKFVLFEHHALLLPVPF